MEFSGTVKPRRRGGWIARGVILEQRFGQIVETQVGPKELPDRDTCVAWLNHAAAQLGIERPRIATASTPSR